MFRNFVNSMDEIAPLFPTRLEALLFKVAMKIPLLKSLPLRFRWQTFHFRARVTDYYGSIEDVLIFREYEFLKAVVMPIQETPVILDAGANIGAFAIYMLSLRPDAIIHSLESSDSTFRYLAQNARLVNHLNWQVHHVALWKEDGNVSFTHNTDLSSASHITANKEGAVTTAISLETFIQKYTPEGHVHILKLDIEGAEDAVLVASERMLNRVDHLVIEIHHDATNEALMEIIRRHFSHLTPIQRGDQTMPLLFASRQPH
jgi:FkbM family methyltransferase